MTSGLQELLDKINNIQSETKRQINFLKEDTSKVDLTNLVDLTAEMEEIMLNQAHNPKKNYPQIITNFLSENPLTTNKLEELNAVCEEFKEFLKS